MTLSETIELIEKAIEHATPGPWHSAGGYLTTRNPESASFRKSIYHLDEFGQEAPHSPFQAIPFSRAQDPAYIAACSPDRMRIVLAAAREAEALTGIGSAHDLISDWLGEGTDDLPDDTPVRIEIGKRTIIADTLGSLRRARALLSKESDEQGGSAITTKGNAT